MKTFVDFVKTKRSSSLKSSKKNLVAKQAQSDIVRNIKLILLILNQNTRNETYYSKWKNILLNKLNIKCNYCQLNIIDIPHRKFKKCSQCKKVYYCCKECQKRDWIKNKHNNICH